MIQGWNVFDKNHSTSATTPPVVLADTNIVPNVHGGDYPGDGAGFPVTEGALIKHVQSITYDPADYIKAVSATVRFRADACGDAFLVDPCITCAAHVFVKSSGLTSPDPTTWYGWAGYTAAQRDLLLNPLRRGVFLVAGVHYMGTAATTLQYHSEQSVGADSGDVVQKNSCWAGEVKLAFACVPQATAPAQGEIFVVCVTTTTPGAVTSVPPYGSRVFADATLQVYKA